MGSVSSRCRTWWSRERPDRQEANRGGHGRDDCEQDFQPGRQTIFWFENGRIGHSELWHRRINVAESLASIAHIKFLLRGYRFLRHGLIACQAEWQLIAATHKLWRAGLAQAGTASLEPQGLAACRLRAPLRLQPHRRCSKGGLR